MKLNSGVLLVFAIPIALAAGAAPLYAQVTGPQRGFNGLFGAGRIEPTARHKLTLTLNSTGAYDNDPPQEVRAAGLVPGNTAGYSTILGGAADYLWQSHRAQVRASGGSSLQYFRPIGDSFYSNSTNASHSAGVGISAQLPGQNTILTNQTVMYSPSYLYNLFPRLPAAGPENAAVVAPDAAPPADTDYANREAISRAYGTSMTLTHDIGRRGSVSATADYQYSDTQVGTPVANEMRTYAIRGRVTHGLTRNTTGTVDYFSRVGYVGIDGAAKARGTLTEHGGEAGVDYRLRLSATREVTIGGRFGASTTKLPESAVEGGPGGEHYTRLSGLMTMGYPFGRTWQASAAYRRGIDYVVGLTEPVSADSFTAGVDGLLSGRVDILTSASYSSGRSALNPDTSVFDTYTGDIRLRYALARVCAAYVEYVYYLYDSHGSAPIAPGIPAGFERSGVRVGFTLLVPALRR